MRTNKAPAPLWRRRNFQLQIFLLLLLVVAAIIAYPHVKSAGKKVVNLATTATMTPTPLPDTTTHAGPSTATQPTATATPTVTATPAPASAPNKPTQTINTQTISLSGGATLMDSTCSTSAGVTCQIIASKDGAKVSVSSSKTTDSMGGVELVWDVKQLSVGTWQIVATATQSSLQTSSDPINLTVIK